MLLLIVASIPMLASDGRREFNSNVQKLATFVAKARNYSLNPDVDNRNAVIYRVNRSGGNFTITAHTVNSYSDTGTLLEGERMNITGGGYTFCSPDVNGGKINFNVSNGSSDALKRIGIKRGSMGAGVEIRADGSIITLSTSPC